MLVQDNVVCRQILSVLSQPPSLSVPGAAPLMAVAFKVSQRKVMVGAMNYAPRVLLI